MEKINLPNGENKKDQNRTESNQKELAKMPSPLDEFRKKIWQLKLKEESAGEEKKETAHFQGWDPDLLQEKDRKVYEDYANEEREERYEEYKEGKISREELLEEFSKYRDEAGELLDNLTYLEKELKKGKNKDKELADLEKLEWPEEIKELKGLEKVEKMRKIIESRAGFCGYLGNMISEKVGRIDLNKIFSTIQNKNQEN